MVSSIILFVVLLGTLYDVMIYQPSINTSILPPPHSNGVIKSANTSKLTVDEYTPLVRPEEKVKEMGKLTATHIKWYGPQKINKKILLWVPSWKGQTLCQPQIPLCLFQVPMADSTLMLPGTLSCSVCFSCFSSVVLFFVLFWKF